jgi:hypothetical protein
MIVLVFQGIIKSTAMWTKYPCWTLPNNWKAVESFYTPLWQEGGTCQITLICDGGYGTPYIYSGGIPISNSYASGSMVVILG